MISIITLIDANSIETASNKTIDVSTASIINQTHKEWELKIVLYNLKQDDTNLIQNVIQGYKDIDSRIDFIKYYDNEITTLSKVFINVVNNECKYNYISVLYINDIWLPNKLELQLNMISKNKQIDVLGSKSSYKTEISKNPDGDLRHYNILKINPFVNSTVIIKKNVLKYLDDELESNKESTISGKHVNNNNNNNNNNISVFLNSLWVRLAIHQCVFYNIGDMTIQHDDNRIIEHYSECYESSVFKQTLDNIRSKYIRIKFFSDYCVSEHIKQEYERACLVQNIDYYGKTKKIYFTTCETYTHAILLNCPTPTNLQVPPQNVIGFAQEPHDTPFLKIYHNNFIEYAIKNIGKYFIGSNGKFPSPTFVGHHGFLFYETPKKMPFRPQKSKVMSIMVSHKMYTPGHQYRHILTQHILRNNWPVHIWGNGSEKYKRQFPNNKNIMGGFKTMEDMCKDYVFTIAIENTTHDHYFTEKIINPIINNTIPLYWGCKKVEDYFPKQTIQLTGNIAKDVGIIHNVLKNPNKYIADYKLDQEMVLRKVNLVNNIEQIFDLKLNV
jgi:hypothetical protein